MRKMLNTLYVTTQGAYLHKEGETVVVGEEVGLGVGQVEGPLEQFEIGALELVGRPTIATAARIPTARQVPKESPRTSSTISWLSRSISSTTVAKL